MLRSHARMFFAGFAAVVAGAVCGWTLLALLPATAPMVQASGVPVAAAAPNSEKPFPPARAPSAAPDPVPPAPPRITETPPPAPPTSAPAPGAAPPNNARDKAPERIGQRNELRFERDDVILYANEDGVGIRTPFGNYDLRW